MENSQMSSKHFKCWVPVCSTVPSDKTIFLSLPSNVKTRELWLALAGRTKDASSFEEIVFCEDHFASSDLIEYKKGLTFTNNLPLMKMPEKICRTCMRIIPANEMFYVLSNTTTTNIPESLQNTMIYYTSHTSLSLGHILSQTIPELVIKFDPPPLICDSCYQSIWLYHAFAVTCIEVEKTLRQNISCESYGKIVLCRSCPRWQGTVFNNIDENSSMASILKNIFGQDDNVKESLPLRLCLVCHGILKKLDEFRNNCLLVEEKLKRHFLLEQEIAERKKNLSIKLKISTLNNQYVPYSLESPKTSILSSNSLEAIPTKTSCVNPILSDQWKKEELAKTFIKYKSKFKDSTNENKIDSVYIMILKKLHKVGITCKLQDVVSAWKELLNSATLKFKKNLPLEFLDELILEFNNEELKKKTKVTPSTSGLVNKTANSAKVGKNITDKVAESDKITNKSKDIDAESDKVDDKREDNKTGPNTIEKEKTKLSKIRPTHLEVITAFEKECNIFFEERKRKGEHQKLSIKNILQRLYDRNKEYQNRPFHALYNKFQYVRSLLINEKHQKSRIFSEILKKENLYQSKAIHQSTSDNSKTVKNPPGRQKKILPVKQNKRNKKTSLSLDEKLMFVKEMELEYKNLMFKDKNKLHSSRPWWYIVNRLAERGFLNYDKDKLYSLWSRLKTSACIHEKDGRDIVDIEIWKLLELHKKTKTNINSIVNIPKEISVNNSDDRGIVTTSEVPLSPKVDSDTTNDSVPCSIDNAVNSVIEMQAPVEFQNKDKTDNKNSTVVPTKTERRSWSEDDKLEIFKLIKNEYNLLLKTQKSSRRVSWTMTIKSIADKGTSRFKQQDIHYIWWSLKNKVMIHEKTDQMSVLDWKVWRFLNKVKGVNISDNKYAVPVQVKNESKLVSLNKRLTDEQKIELISIVKELGSSIFTSYKAPNENPAWNQICEKMKQKGHIMPKFKIKNCWRGLEKSATLAMADQKPASKFDKIIIDFMKTVAYNKTDIISSTKTDDSNSIKTDDPSSSKPDDSSNSKSNVSSITRTNDSNSTAINNNPSNTNTDHSSNAKTDDSGNTKTDDSSNTKTDDSGNTNTGASTSTNCIQLPNNNLNKTDNAIFSENSSNSDSCQLVYEYVSKEDVEAETGKIRAFEHINVKSEMSTLSFKEEINTVDVDDIIDLCDGDDSDDVFQENSEVLPKTEKLC